MGKWEEVSIEDIAFVKGGKRLPKGGKLLDTITDYPYIRVSDFTEEGSIEVPSVKYLSEDIYHQISKYTISSNDVYISIAGTIGKTGIIPKILEGANLTENATKLVFKEDVDVYNKYILLFTKSLSFKEQAGLATRVVAMPKLALTRLKKIKIPLPPLVEQKKIVAKLDELFERIDKSILLLEENIQHTKDLMASVLDEEFSKNSDNWELSTWNDVLTIINGKNQKAVLDDNGEFPIYGSGGIMAYANDYLCPENCTIIGRKGTINKPIYVETKFWNVDTAFGINAGEKIDSKFLYYFCKGYNFTQHNKSTTLPSLAKRDLLQIEMKFPVLEEQYRIIAKLDEFNRIKEDLTTQQTKKLEHLKSLKSSLLDKAFKGELV